MPRILESLKRILLRRRAGVYYPVRPRFRWLLILAERYGHGAALSVRMSLSLIAVAHLALVALLPGGRNGMLDLESGAGPDYLTLLPAEAPMGFYQPRGKDGFVVYRIYTEQGKIVEGRFPDVQLTPPLRYDRWALLSHHLGGNYPEFHGLFMNYLLERLPGSPLKLELLSAKWNWKNHGAPLAPPGNGKTNGGTLILRDLGTYDGLRRQWEPSRRKMRQ
ncbi:MAG: hypothetical protein O6934_04915 [SAR324 cluster bacterium]|nr:hypothetical protein [SAR324 cluster bacterium]